MNNRLAELIADAEEPSGCPSCFLIAGCCKDYPNCPGNPKWQAVADSPIYADCKQCGQLHLASGPCPRHRP